MSMSTNVRPSLAVSCSALVIGQPLRVVRRSWFLAALIGCFHCSSLAVGLNSAHAADATPPATKSVTFAQQWTAGQKWNYDVKLIGKIGLRLPENAGVPIAGMELKDIAYQSSARLTLDVLEADANGVGTIAFRTDHLVLTAESGPGALEIENGEAAFYYGETMFGQPQKLPLDDFKNPRDALRLDPRGHLEGLSPISNDAAPQATPDATLPFDLTAMTHMFDPRTLPALWPDHAVAPGDTWSSEVLLPIKTGDADTDAKLASAGILQFSYVGSETDLLKRAVHKIHVTGTIKISEEQAALLAAQLGDKREGKTLDSFQKVDGDLWFDAAVGQVRRADVKLQTYTAREAFANVGGKQQNNSSWFTFEGRGRLDLRDAPTAPKTPAR
jgi:hypothetical protein